MRRLSYSEISTAQTCFARWDFGYGGHLVGGDALAPRIQAPILSDGRAWGAACAAFHASSDLTLWSAAHEAMEASYVADLAEMAEAGVMVDLAEHELQRQRLAAILEHYMATTLTLGNLTRLEHEFEVPVPSRGGRRGSNLYRFGCFIDGYTTDVNDREWLVEFKLRRSLQPVSLVQKMRQYRWYAWAARKAGHDPIGIIVDERFNELPHAPNINKDGRVSADKRQRVTIGGVYDALDAAGQDSEDPKVLEQYRGLLEAATQIRWQQRVPIMFRPGELDEAGRELTAAAKVIRDLDSGVLYPMRNASRANCGNCRFEPVCSEPTDALYIDTLFSRVPPKRLRSEAGTTELQGSAAANPFEAFA